MTFLSETLLETLLGETARCEVAICFGALFIDRKIGAISLSIVKLGQGKRKVKANTF